MCGIRMKVKIQKLCFIEVLSLLFPQGEMIHRALRRIAYLVYLMIIYQLLMP